VEVCYFGARKMDGGELTLDRDNCYGCGLCVEVCPEDCLKMVPRE
jgi:Fe-S-cluster-containing hydrogenase component 2